MRTAYISDIAVDVLALGGAAKKHNLDVRQLLHTHTPTSVTLRAAHQQPSLYKAPKGRGRGVFGSPTS